MKPAAPAAAVAAGAAADLLAGSALAAAPALIGWTLTVGGVGGVIVECEAYCEDDPASHSVRGPRGRAVTMFGAPGTLYVYRSYGLHWCLNLVCGPIGCGEAVLIRALAPTIGEATMRERRPRAQLRDLCRGPGRLCAALAIDGSFDGHDAASAPVPLLLEPPRDSPQVLAGPRIGISHATERPWRFGLASSSHLSRPFPSGVTA